MIEELSMKDKYGEEYDEYRAKTPFLFPLPKWLIAVFKAPMRLITKEKFPQNRRQVAGILLVYTFIFMIVSLIWIDLGSGSTSEMTAVSNPDKVIDSITNEIQNTTERRVMYRHFNVLGKLGSPATEKLLVYLSDSDPVKREFAANQLGRIKDTAAVWPLIFALEDEIWRVKRSVSIALAEIGDQRAAKPLFEMMVKSAPEERSTFYPLMGKFRVKEAWPYLVDGLESEIWYIMNEALQALVDIDAEKAIPYVFDALQDTNHQVRRKAVFILLDEKKPEAMIPLQQVLNDKDFEVRFYAQQAIKMIEESENK